MRRALILFVLALAALDAAAQQFPERRQVRRGNRAYEKGNYPDAAGRYLRALGADSTSFEARYNLGNALHRQEMYEQAEQVQREAAADTLAAPADRAEAFYNLGNTQFRQKRYPEALESYKNALRLNPDDLQTKFNYAYVKKLLDEQNRQDQDKENNDDQNKDDRNEQNKPDPQEGKEDPERSEPQSGDDQQGDGQQGEPDEQSDGEGRPQPAGISPAEQERMLDAIQAQEDKTQEKLKEKAGAVVRLKKNW